MPTTFPTILDTLTNPTSGDALATVGEKLHPDQHADLNDAMEAVQTKLGTGAAIDYARLGAVPFLHLQSGVDKTIFESIATSVNWEIELEDTFGFHTGTDSVFTIPLGYAGLYYILPIIDIFVSGPFTYHSQLVTLNGPGVYPVLQNLTEAPPDFLSQIGHPGWIIRCSPGDAFQILATQNSGIGGQIKSTSQLFVVRIGR